MLWLAMGLELTDRQRNIAATAVTVLSLLVILAAAGASLWLVASLLRRFSNVLLPLAVAGVAALVFRPYYEFLHTRLRLPAPLALVVLLLSALVPLVAFAWFFGALIVDQVSGLVARLPDWWDQARVAFESRWPRIVDFLDHDPLGQRIRGAMEGQQGALVGGLQFLGGKALSAGAGLLRGVGWLLNWAVLPVYLVFFLTAGGIGVKKPEDYLPFLKPDTRRDVIFLINEFVNILVAFFRGQLLIAVLQGLLFAIGFSVVGLEFGFVLGLMLGFLNVVPYLGSMLGLAITLPLAFFQQGGGWSTLIGVGVVFVVVQMIEGYVLTPRIMGQRTGLHPVAIIVAIFFWGSALSGVLGMILAIPLTAFLVVFWRLAREKYIQEWV